MAKVPWDSTRWDAVKVHDRHGGVHAYECTGAVVEHGVLSLVGPNGEALAMFAASYWVKVVTAGTE